MRSQNSILKQYFKIKLIEGLLLPFRLLKIKQNRVVLLSWMGYKFAGNPKYIAIELESSSKLEIYYAVKKREIDIEKAHPRINFIKFGSVKYFYIVMTSKVFVTDGGGVAYIPFRKKQFVINTWHGGGAYKKIGLPALGNTELVKRFVRNDSKKYNVYLSSSRRFSEIFEASKLIDRDIFAEVGMPRNDVLINGNCDMLSHTKQVLGIEGKKVVLYAPTFRDYSENPYIWGMPQFDIDVEGVIHRLKEKMGGEWIFLYRGHPNVGNINANFTNVMDITQYEEMQDLLLIADVLITDYSSSMWDFALTNKPGFIYATDIEEYCKFRDFESPMEDWPYPVSRNNSELLSAINNYEEEKALAKIEKHLKMLDCKETGYATEYVSRLIVNVCKENR